jgi:hypothetical protein
MSDFVKSFIRLAAVRLDSTPTKKGQRADIASVLRYCGCC